MPASGFAGFSGPGMDMYGGGFDFPDWAYTSNEGMAYCQQLLMNNGMNPYQLGHNPDTNPYWEYGYNPYVYSGYGKGWMCDQYGNPTNQWYQDFYPYVNGRFQTYMNPELWRQAWAEKENGMSDAFWPGHTLEDFEDLKKEHNQLVRDFRELQPYIQHMDDMYNSQMYWGGGGGGGGGYFGSGYVRDRRYDHLMPVHPTGSPGEFRQVFANAVNQVELERRQRLGYPGY